MRVLLAWELGLNCEHLARLLPIAERLRDNGHVVLVAIRRVDSAASVLRPKGIRFLQAPRLPMGIPLQGRATGDADIPPSQGWSNRKSLWGLVQGWLAIFELFHPGEVLLDYSPTANLTAGRRNALRRTGRESYRVYPPSGVSSVSGGSLSDITFRMRKFQSKTYVHASISESITE